VKVDPMEPILKPPGSKHLKLKCDIVLSTFAFKINLRRYSEVLSGMLAGAYTRPLFSPT